MMRDSWLGTKSPLRQHCDRVDRPSSTVWCWIEEYGVPGQNRRVTGVQGNKGPEEDPIRQLRRSVPDPAGQVSLRSKPPRDGMRRCKLVIGSVGISRSGHGRADRIVSPGAARSFEDRAIIVVKPSRQLF